MFDLSKKLKLRKGYDKIYRVTRYGRLMLTYSEVQRRLDNHYGGKLTIVEYNGVDKKGILHCKNCGTFETKVAIGDYLRTNYSHRTDCEKCMKYRQLRKYTSKLNDSLECIDYYTLATGTHKVKIVCKVCGTLFTRDSKHLNKQTSCLHCLEIEKIKRYKDIVSNFNCTYTAHYVVDGKVYLKIKCDDCGTERTIGSTQLYEAVVLCRKCNENHNDYKFERSKEEVKDLLRNGKHRFISYDNSNKVVVEHLLCGNTTTSNKDRLQESYLCRHCRTYISCGKPKEHNKNLVEDYLTILYNVKTLKDFLVKHNQLQNVPEEPRTILEHAEGWLSNYKFIMEKYPNGDFGTILENNPLYEKCRKAFYPVMRRYNLEIKE